jgi:predicted nucleic acid-binding protein
MTEVLVRPYRESNQRLVDEFRGLLNIYPNLTWIAPDLNIADRAARYRAQHRLRTPDAIQAATAVHTGATGFITNDAAFKRVPAFESLVLEDSL